MSIPENKYCKICGKHIANIDESDWFSYMSIKYCKDCKADVKREQNRLTAQQLRERAKEKRKLERERHKLIETENELLRKENLKIQQRIRELERALK